MKTLVVAATELEIAASIPTFVETKTDYLVTGVGMVATAFALGQYLQGKSYDLLINVGISGTFNPYHKLGALLKIKTDRVFEFGAENDQDFIPIDSLGFGNSVFVESLPETALPAEFYEIPYVDAITVNKVHGADNSIDRIKKEHGLNLLESMEGAAFFYAANKLRLPCVQVRSISNLVEKRNVENWNIPLALNELNSWLQRFLIALQDQKPLL